jgi:hypothetical protein
VGTRRRKAWTGKAIVAFQVALSMLLVVAAGLFLRTVINLNSVDPGFVTDHLVLFDIDPPDLSYPAPKDVALHVRLEETLRALPGVEGVTASVNPLLAGSFTQGGFFLEGAKTQPARGDKRPYLKMAWVGTDFISVRKVRQVRTVSGYPSDSNTIGDFVMRDGR